MRLLIIALILYFSSSLSAQYQYRTDNNADIIKSILEDRIPVQKNPYTVTPLSTSGPSAAATPSPAVQRGAIESPTASAKKSAPAAKKGSAGKSSSKGGKGSDIPQAAGADKNLLEQGIHFYESGNNGAAADKLKLIREKFASGPYSDQSSIWLARVYIREGKTADALSELAKIGEESGEYPASLFLASQIHRSLQKYDLAVESLNRISSRFPGHELADDALIEAGKIHLSLKNGQLALSAAAQVIRSYPDRENLDDAYFLIGTILEKDTQLRDLEKAYLVFKKFVFRAETEKVETFARSPLLGRVKNEIIYLEKNFLKVR